MHSTLEMADFAFWLSLLALLASGVPMLVVGLGLRKLRRLVDSKPVDDANCPGVSIVIAALDEAQTIEPALRSVLALDYPRLEVIVVDDRSTDATGGILDRLAVAHPNLRVLHIRALPPGWLGKNHALFRGAEIAGGDFILFTDADVAFESRSIRRAAGHCERNQLDHLAAFPSVPVREPLLAMMLLMFKGALLFRYQPWKSPESARHYLGIGAFNMVRASAYRNAGGHAALPLEVLDDIMLGWLMKQNGGRQEILDGGGAVEVEWYRNTREFVRGVQKNAFASVGYSVAKVAGGSVILLAVRLWPWIGLFLTHGAAWWINLAAIAVSVAFNLALIRNTGWSRWCLLYLPVSSLVAVYALWRSCLYVMLQGGVEWRGTRYALADLKRAHRELHRAQRKKQHPTA